MKVSLFITCLSDMIYPRAGIAMVEILARYGIRLDFPESQTCCGQPAFNSGYWDAARASGRTLLRAFESSDFVVSPSGSCTEMIRAHYPELFKDDSEYAEKARQLSEKTYEFTQFLVQVLGVTDLGAVFPHKVTYHPSCHGTRLLGVKDEPLQLMGHIKGLELLPLPRAEDCCGFGGTFAVKMSEISGAMVEEKADHVLETEAEVLVGIDLACLMNISGNLQHRGKPIKVMHIAELLNEGVKRASADS